MEASLPPFQEIPLDVVWGECIYWSQAKENAEKALEVASTELDKWRALLAAGEAQNDTEA